jgi:hypothetical protein
MRRVERVLVIIAVLACPALAAVGCGSSSDSTSMTSEKNVDGTASVPTDETPTASEEERASKRSKPKSGKTEGSGTPEVDTESNESGKNQNGAPLGSDTSKGSDNSIETYGSNAEGPEREEVVGAMRAFDVAIANREFDKVCSELAAKIRAGLAESHKQCPELLNVLVTTAPSVARGSANAKVTHVRIGGGNAFVLFRPPGSSRLYYFVMTREDGIWKSLGLTVGTPINPEVPTGQ